MNLAVMQPYFFPYIGYFQLMNWADHWVVFDDVQFIDKGWVNRNRVLHPDPAKEWQYITVPLVKHSRYDKIRSLTINASQDWRAQILGKLTSYRRQAPFYQPTVEFVSACLACEQPDLSGFLVDLLKRTATYLDIDTTIEVQSDLNLSLGEVSHPGQWSLRIAEALGASTYCNPHGGAEIFREYEFQQSGIDLKFLKPRLDPYIQRRDGFVPGLSIIDVMMWNSPEEISELLSEKHYELLRQDEL